MSRLDELIAGSHAILDAAIAEHITDAGKELVGTVALFSGGNDSTVLTHLMRERATHAAHANTGIGIEATRVFVRETSAAFGLPLIEVHPPAGSTYRELVIAQGFPGPAMHWKMYQRLKERGLRQVRGQLVDKPRRQRVIFLAGRRRDESQRRMNVPEQERDGSIVFVSPLVEWTKLDLNDYRRRFPDVPRNVVADTLHMSGECLCGAFAVEGEREQIAYWYPEVEQHLTELEAEVAAAGIPEPRCRWGWGEDRALTKAGPSKSGPLCSSCDARAVGGGS